MFENYHHKFTITNTLDNECSKENNKKINVRRFEEINPPLFIENVNKDKIIENSKLNISFEGFNNVVGADRFIVPNIIHFVRFNNTKFSFIDYVVIKAAMSEESSTGLFLHSHGRTWTG